MTGEGTWALDNSQSSAFPLWPGHLLKIMCLRSLTLPVLNGLVWGRALDSVLLKASRLIRMWGQPRTTSVDHWGKGRDGCAGVRCTSNSYVGLRSWHPVKNHCAPWWLKVHSDMQDPALSPTLWQWKLITLSTSTSSLIFKMGTVFISAHVISLPQSKMSQSLKSTSHSVCQARTTRI